jgi:hypothetical protein
LFSAFVELFHPEPASVPDAKLGFSNASPQKMLHEIAFSRHARPVSFRHRPFVCPVRPPIDSGSSHHVGEIKWVSGKVVNISIGEKGIHFVDFCDDQAACPFTMVVFASDLKDVGDVRRLEGQLSKSTGPSNCTTVAP